MKLSFEMSELRTSEFLKKKKIIKKILNSDRRRHRQPRRRKERKTSKYMYVYKKKLSVFPCRWCRTSRYHNFSLVKVNVLLCTEIASQRDAVQIAKRLDHTRILNGPHVKQQHERR